MARPRFVVKHFIACLNAKWDGPPSAFTTRTLEGVSHVYRVPRGTEAPTFDEFWLYARFYLLNKGSSIVPLWIEVARAQTGGSTPSFAVYPPLDVRFVPERPIVNATFAIRPFQVFTTGRYEFRLMRKRRWRDLDENQYFPNELVNAGSIP